MPLQLLLTCNTSVFPVGDKNRLVIKHEFLFFLQKQSRLEEL